MKIVQQSATLVGLMLPVEMRDDGVYLHTPAVMSEEQLAVWLQPGAPERLIEAAGRTCYKSEGKITEDSYKPFIDKVCNQLGHESVMEHSSASFRIVCDRGVSHEIVRHRLASYSQESTRFCNYGLSVDGIQLIPMMTGLTDAQVQRRLALYLHCEEVYLAELKEGVKPQQARDNLPTCLKTELVMTCNFREWKHFLKMRLAPAAHPKMRACAWLIRDILIRIAPTLFEDFKEVE
jgi:thymidylate synthase (FAD)